MSVQGFVLEPGQGARVYLRPLPGAPPVADDVRHRLEQEMRRRFASLAMTTEPTVQVEGRPFRLEKQPTDDPRLPRLVLTALDEAADNPAEAGCWRDGLLADLRRLADELCDAPHHERSALRGGADELCQRLAEAPGGEAGLLLVAYLVTAEAHFRASDADRAGQYALALRALRRRLPGVTEELRVPVPAAETPGNRSFLAECFTWLFGTDTA
jgi:hypothetical protein